ncbi:MAG: general secretion pathway protein GspK [Acidobacteria bacterium]|nr:general secretion pathway protein GspK [Acidobacteriota bacterium]
MCKRTNRKGGALLTVLWLSAALSAIAFSVATTVRGETERTSTHMDHVRAYYLATGAVDRALLWMQIGPGPRRPDGQAMFFEYGWPVLTMPFPTGLATVELIPESARLNVNRATPQELGRLLLAMGVAAEPAQAIVAGILDWRTTIPGPSPLDGFYSSLGPAFQPRRASLEQIEELLYVRGVTPELFHGTWSRDASGVLVRLPGLKDCLTVYGFNTAYDINVTPAPVLMAAGVPADVVAAIVERRSRQPFLRAEELNPFTGPAQGKVRLGGNSIFTLRATATLKAPAPNGLSDVRRTVAAVVKFNVDVKDDPSPYWILRWYDNAGTN